MLAGNVERDVAKCREATSLAILGCDDAWEAYKASALLRDIAETRRDHAEVLAGSQEGSQAEGWAREVVAAAEKAEEALIDALHAFIGRLTEDRGEVGGRT